MKKICLFLSVLLLFSILTACSSSTASQETAAPEETAVPEETVEPEATEAPEETTEPEESETESNETIDIAGLKGPTGIGMVQIMDNIQNGSAPSNWNISISADPSEVAGKVISGELEIAAVPTNLASVIYNKTEGAVQVLALNTLGVLQVLQNTDLESEAVTSIEDLKGKTIVMNGQAANPEYVVKYLLSQNGIDPENDVTFEFFATADEVLGEMANNGTEIAILPEPSATAATVQMANYSKVLDLNEVWNNTTTDGSKLTMGCLIVNKAFAEANPDVITEFMTAYEASIDFALNDIDAASELLETYGIIPKAAIAKESPSQSAIFALFQTKKFSLH